MTGRKRALNDDQVAAVRDAWERNNAEWAAYRTRPFDLDGGKEPIRLSMEMLARRFRVSPGVIAHVIDRKGAYTE